MQLKPLLTIFLLALALTSVNSEWKVIAPHLATIIMGVSFTDANNGWVAGAANGAGSVIFNTTDGGAHWVPTVLGEDSLSLFDISMYHSVVAEEGTTTGFASGIGIAKFKGSVYSYDDGASWNISDTRNLLSVFQSVGHTDALGVWQVGTWVSLFNTKGNGVMLSLDGGRNFIGHNWNQNTSARYGSFIDVNNGFIAGGSFPSSSSALLTSDANHAITQHFAIVDGLPKFLLAGGDSEYVREMDSENGTFAASLAVTYNAGKNWTNLYHNNGTEEYGFYFNGINFINTTFGWVAGEGVNETTNDAYAFIWATTDGGKTWNQQLYVDQGSIIQVKMISATYGWAVGGITEGRGMKGAFWQTTDGKNWTLETEIDNCYLLNLDVVDENNAYAVGVTSVGLSSVYAYHSA